MLRKLSLVAVAAASLGAAALAPTSASAGGWHHGGWHHHHHGWGGPRVFIGSPAYYAGGYGGCYARRLVSDPLGYALAAGEPLLLS
jgi:opacity protein-like surface antigen